MISQGTLSVIGQLHTGANIACRSDSADDFRPFTQRVVLNDVMQADDAGLPCSRLAFRVDFSRSIRPLYQPCSVCYNEKLDADTVERKRSSTDSVRFVFLSCASEPNKPQRV